MSDLRGGCMCGAVRFEVHRPLVLAGYCHCTRCQRRTGTAASCSARIEPGSLRVTKGGDVLAAYEPGGDGFAKFFCSRCGSALWSRHPEHHEVISIRLGAFDGDPGIRPTYRQYVAYAAAWEPVPDDGLERFPEGRVAPQPWAAASRSRRRASRRARGRARGRPPSGSRRSGW